MSSSTTLQPADALGAAPLAFVRHGATQPNKDGLRCGGDLDLPMTAQGEAQVAAAVRQMRCAAWPIDLIVASDLQRTRATAALISDLLGGVPIEIDSGWRERALGEWNLRPIVQTEAALRAGLSPPNGEASVAFSARIAAALLRLLARRRTRMPLLVGSKGVARVLGELLDARRTAPAGNGQVLCFDLTPLLRRTGTAAPGARATPRLAAMHALPIEATP